MNSTKLLILLVLPSGIMYSSEGIESYFPGRNYNPSHFLAADRHTTKLPSSQTSQTATKPVETKPSGQEDMETFFPGTALSCSVAVVGSRVTSSPQAQTVSETTKPAEVAKK